MKLEETLRVEPKETLKPQESPTLSWLQDSVQSAVLATTLLVPQFVLAHEGHDQYPVSDPENMTDYRHFSLSLDVVFNSHVGCELLHPLIAVQGSQSNHEFRHRLEHDRCMDIHGALGVQRTLTGAYLPNGAVVANTDNFTTFHSAFEFPILSLPNFALKAGPGIGLEYRLGQNSYYIFHLGLDVEINTPSSSIVFELVPEFIQGTNLSLSSASITAISVKLKLFPFLK